MTTMQRWKGLSALLGDAVEQGATAVERIHMETAQKPFAIIEQIPGIAAPTKLVHGVHDAVVGHVYNEIRFWNGLVQRVIQTALRDDSQQPPAPDTPADEAAS